jgi:hypothetical protein
MVVVEVGGTLVWVMVKVDRRKMCLCVYRGRQG